MSVLVDLGAALICFAGQCYPALVGENTPTGEFQFSYYSTEAAGFGGTLLVFKENDYEVWGVHRVIDVPGQNRLQRLQMGDPASRVKITGGCINIDPTVYEDLVNCCSAEKITIK